MKVTLQVCLQGNTASHICPELKPIFGICHLLNCVSWSSLKHVIGPLMMHTMSLEIIWIGDHVHMLNYCIIHITCTHLVTSLVVSVILEDRKSVSLAPRSLGTPSKRFKCTISPYSWEKTTVHHGRKFLQMRMGGVGWLLKSTCLQQNRKFSKAASTAQRERRWGGYQGQRTKAQQSWGSGQGRIQTLSEHWYLVSVQEDGGHKS